MDPWGDKVEDSVSSEFEDNFVVQESCNNLEKLADSEQYLAVLERRLASLRAKNNIVENLSAYRADCIERLLREGCAIEPVSDTDKEQLIQKKDGTTYCVVTGASKGIGKALAIEVSTLLGRGSVLLLLARDENDLSAVAEVCRSSKVTVDIKSMDLGSATDADMQQALSDALGDRDISDFDTFIIFHNVGSIGNLAIDTQCIENTKDIHEYYNLNVFNVISLNTQFLKLIRGYEDRAVVVNVTSLCATKPMVGMAFYCSGKAAREMYFRVLAEEMKQVKVLNYAPGPVETSMIDYILDETVNNDLKQVFESFKSQKVLLKPEVTARKCMKVLVEGRFMSGEHVDYFDDE